MTLSTIGNNTYGPGRAGLVVAVPLFCRPCLERGHQCMAREGSDECIFCEDKVPCPAMQRAVTAHAHERPTSSPPRLQGDALLSPQALNKKRAQPIVTVHAGKPEEFLKHGGKELIRAAVKEMAVKRKEHNTPNPSRVCNCGCGGQLKGRWPYLAGHNNGNAVAGGGQSVKKQPRKKLQRSAAQVAGGNRPAHHIAFDRGVRAFEFRVDGERTAASLVVSEAQLDHMFVSWPLEDKVMCVQSWLDRLGA